MILDSPLGTTFKLRGPDVWRSADRALEKVFAECAAEAPCDAAHPRLRARFYRRVHALRRHPDSVEFPLAAGNTFRRLVGGDELLVTPQPAPEILLRPGLPARLEAAATGRVTGYYAGAVLTPPARRDVSTAEGKAAVSRCHDQIAFERDSE